MYLLRTEFQVAPGRAGELEERQTQMGTERKGQPGYLGQTLLHSYGQPGKYVATSRWASVEAVWAYGKTDAFAAYIKNSPPGLVTVTRQEGYDSVFEVDADNAAQNPGSCEILVDWTINLGAAADFEASRREIFELRKKLVKGFSSNRLRRHAGNRNKYLILQMYADTEAARAADSVPELRAFGAAHQPSLYAAAPPVGEAYYVVHRI